MCGEEKEEAEKSPLYDYKRAYFKIVQALIDDHRTAFKIFVEFSNFWSENSNELSKFLKIKDF